MKKVVLKLHLHDDKIKQKAMMIVSSIPGVDSVSVDMKEEKLTVVGDIDTVSIVQKLRKKLCPTEVVSVGPAKEPEKKKEEPKQPAPPPAIAAKPFVAPAPGIVPYYYHNNYHAYHRGVEEDPNACVIC